MSIANYDQQIEKRYHPENFIKGEILKKPKKAKVQKVTKAKSSKKPKKVLAKYQVVRKEIDDSHYYWINDEFVPATTEILGVAGPVEYGLRSFWQNNSASDANTIVEQAKEFGSLVHNSIERLLLGDTINLEALSSTMPFYKKDFKKHMMSFYDWFHAFKPDLNSIKTEQVVGSKKYKFGGTVDLYCKKDGKAWIIDFKTSSGIYLSHKMQLAAYKIAYEEYTGKKIDKVAILRTGSRHKAGYEFKEIEENHKDAFLNIYQVYLAMNNGKIPQPPEVVVYPEELSLYEKN